MTTMTVSSSEFRRNMPSIVGKAEESGATIVVIKNSRPWFEIRPLARSHDEVPTEETLEALRDLEVMRKTQRPVYRDVSQFFADLGI